MEGQLLLKAVSAFATPLSITGPAPLFRHVQCYYPSNVTEGGLKVMAIMKLR